MGDAFGSRPVLIFFTVFFGPIDSGRTDVMKRMLSLATMGCVVAGSLFLAGTAFAGGEIYGTVYTVDGDEITGAIRWDKNENFWDDVIDANKTERVRSKDREGFNLRLFGLEIIRSGHSRGWSYSQFTIPFGHLASIEPLRGNKVELTLKNGEVLEVKEGADLGRGVRGIVVSGPEGEEKLEWEDLARVEFSSSPGGGRDQERLYGTVETTIGNFTGYVVWDADESLLEDILDGEHKGRDRKIPFEKIASIEKASNRASLVTLKTGTVLKLSGTNDVDDDNRGITVTISNLGSVRMEWRQFKKVTFEDPPASLSYADFDGGFPIHGTLTTTDGETLIGDIVWDMDERYSWEALNGEIKGVEFKILFQNIASIERIGQNAAKVWLKDGLDFTLQGSNDVNRKNKGIVVSDGNGGTVELGWDDLQAVAFEGGQ